MVRQIIRAADRRLVSPFETYTPLPREISQSGGCGVDAATRDLRTYRTVTQSAGTRSLGCIAVAQGKIRRVSARTSDASRNVHSTYEVSCAAAHNIRLDMFSHINIHIAATKTPLAHEAADVYVE